jgi:hypothetical protein
MAEGANMFESGRSSDPKLTYAKRFLEKDLSVMNAMLDAGNF